MISKIRNKKGFTIIELMVVIIIIGILVLLATPKLLGYAKDAKLSQIKNDVKAHENAIATERISSDKFIDDWDTVDSIDLEEFRNSNSLFDKRGVVVDSVFSDSYLKIPSNLINSKLKGDFIVTKGGRVFYHDETFNVDNEESEQSGPSDIDLGMESDFKWIDISELDVDVDGYFQYVGTGEEIVEIPHVIQGVEITSYLLMFSETGADVKKVISTNRNVSDMKGMFSESQVTSLDLSEFDTSNVKYMNGMFANLNVESLDLSSFDTSKVIHMSGMFNRSEMTNLDLSSFDTSNVTLMEGMFVNSKLTTLDLSNFDTSNVTVMNNVEEDDLHLERGMFQGSESETIILGENFTVDKVESFINMFRNSKVSEIIGLNNLNPSNATDVAHMFSYTESLTSLDLSLFNISKVSSLSEMFYGSSVEKVFVYSREDAERLSNSLINPSRIHFIFYHK